MSRLGWGLLCSATDDLHLAHPQVEPEPKTVAGGPARCGDGVLLRSVPPLVEDLEVADFDVAVGRDQHLVRDDDRELADTFVDGDRPPGERATDLREIEGGVAHGEL